MKPDRAKVLNGYAAPGSQVAIGTSSGVRLCEVLELWPRNAKPYWQVDDEFVPDWSRPRLKVRVDHGPGAGGTMVYRFLDNVALVSYGRESQPWYAGAYEKADYIRLVTGYMGEASSTPDLQEIGLDGDEYSFIVEVRRV